MRVIYKAPIQEQMQDAISEAFTQDRAIQAFVLTEDEHAEYRRWLSQFVNYGASHTISAEPLMYQGVPVLRPGQVEARLRP